MAHLFNDRTRPPEPSNRGARPAKWSSVSGSSRWFYESMALLQESIQEFHGNKKLVCRMFQYPYIPSYKSSRERQKVEEALKQGTFTKFHPMLITGLKETYTPLSVETLMLNGRHHFDRLGVSPLSIDVAIILPAIYLKDFLLEFDAYKKSLQSTEGLSLIGFSFSNFVLAGLYNYISVSYAASSPGVAQVSLNLTIFDILRDFSGMYTDLLSSGEDPEVYDKEVMGLVLRPYRLDDENYGNVRRPTQIHFSYYQDAIPNGQQYSPREKLEDKAWYKASEYEEGTFITRDFTFGDTSVLDLFKTSFGSVGQISSIAPYEFSITLRAPPSPNGGDEVKRFLWNYLMMQERFKYTYVDILLPQGESSYLGLKGVLQPFSVDKIAKSPTLDTFNLSLRVSSVSDGLTSSRNPSKNSPPAEKAPGASEKDKSSSDYGNSFDSWYENSQKNKDKSSPDYGNPFDSWYENSQKNKDKSLPDYGNFFGGWYENYRRALLESQESDSESIAAHTLRGGFYEPK